MILYRGIWDSSTSPPNWRRKIEIWDRSPTGALTYNRTVDISQDFNNVTAIAENVSERM